LRVSKAPSAVTVAISWPGGIWSSSSGSIPRRLSRTGGVRLLDIADLTGRELGGPDFQGFLMVVGKTVHWTVF
jgi:hypothetical protein